MAGTAVGVGSEAVWSEWCISVDCCVAKLNTQFFGECQCFESTTEQIECACLNGCSFKGMAFSGSFSYSDIRCCSDNTSWTQKMDLFLIPASWKLQWYGSGRFGERGRRSFTLTWCSRIHCSFIGCLSASFRDCCRSNKSIGCSGGRKGTLLYFVKIWTLALITTCLVSWAHFLPQQHALHSVCPHTFGQWCWKAVTLPV